MSFMKRLVVIAVSSVAALGSLSVLGVTSASADTSHGIVSQFIENVAYSHKVLFPTKAAWSQGVGGGGIAHAATSGQSSNSAVGQLVYQGGVDNIGVTTGPPKVYVVFWGSQWGTASTTNGRVTLSGDPAGVAPLLQNLYAGLGTNGELWSGVMTQYCEGVSAGTTTCPSSNGSHVAYPTGGALAGVWVDGSAAAPSVATGNQIAKEAVAAASHFGNVNASENRDAQYVIVSPSGTHPDGFNTSSGNFCAWHDWNGDSSLSGGAAPSSVGDIAFTNLPYLPNAGAQCGANYVNAGSAGSLDGVSIVAGHEYAETVTDQNPGGGWLDASGNENGDKCAWVGVGGTGGAQNLTLATGVFAMQATWSNSTHACAFSAAVVNNPSPSQVPTITVTNPGTQSAKVGTSVSLQIVASDSAGATMTFSATGLPAGLSMNASTGLISGTPGASGTSSVVVQVSDTDGASTTITFSFVVAPATATVTIANPGTQQGTVNSLYSLSLSATTTTPHGVLTFTASGLPSGLSLRAGTNVISGTPVAAGTTTVTIKAADSSGVSAQTSFLFIVAPVPRCTIVIGNLVTNSKTLVYNSVLGMSSETLTGTLTLPAGCSAYSFSYGWEVRSGTTAKTAVDTMTVAINNTVLGSYSNLNSATTVHTANFNLAAFAGSQITLRVTFVESHPKTPTLFYFLSPTFTVS